MVKLPYRSIMATDNPFRALPSVDGLLAHERLRPLGEGGRPVVTQLVRQALETPRAAVAAGYSNLEFDLDAGVRGSRFTHLESALRQLTGADAAMAVNNNAS